MTTDFSQDPQDNPYSSPEIQPLAGAAGSVGVTPRRTYVDYMQAYTFIFENPNWVATILLLGLITFLPLLGALVLYGYVFELVAVLAYGRTQYPDFNFDRFGAYLARGFWIFLAILAYVSIVVVVLLILLTVAGILGAVLGEGVGVLMFVLAQLIYVALVIAINFVTIPAAIRVGLSNQLSEAFNFEWIKDFVSRMWLEMILCGLFLWISSLILTFVGMMALCVGIVFAAAMVAMAMGHLCFQLYQVYLSRGGQPVPISTK